MSTVELLTDLISAGVKAAGESTPRSQQSAAGLIGPSNIGWCHMKALLMMRGVPESDSVELWPMQVGTWMHDGLRAAKAESFPNWIQDKPVTATLPSGYEISGTPDTVVPEYNTVIDDKSKDGFERVLKEGQSQSDIYQLTIYALALIQQGTLDATKPLWLVNMYWDRSGREKQPVAFGTLFTYELVNLVDAWIGAVVYANLNGEDAERDIDPIMCRKMCSHATACRGKGLPVSGENPYLNAPELRLAVDMAVESKVMKKKAERMYDEAKDSLRGVNGVTDDHQVRWTTVNGRGSSHLRLDITPI